MDTRRLLASLHLHSMLHHASQLNTRSVRAARKYIRDFWPLVERYHPKDDASLLGLPNPYLVPSYDEKATFDYDELYYWDSYFMAQGLLDDKHSELVRGILEDLTSLFKRFSIIPNASRTYLMGRSQPPFLTSFIFDVYDAYKLDKKWLKEMIAIAEKEYTTVWMGTRKPNDRQVYRGLSRYYDINVLNDLAEAESGWDMTTRFGQKALQYVPVDLNALLYKYEADFSRAAQILGKDKESVMWNERAEARKQTMNELMWDRIRGLYFDYDYDRKRRGNVSSLAAYYPMWAGMVDANQAEGLVRSLRRFETRGGLATTDGLPILGYIERMPTQWAYPNGWAPLHFIVVQALERYGYHADARRIALKWLKCNLWWFNKHGVFLEKYNVVNPTKPPVKGVYPTQAGFGWTNAIFERFCRDYIDKRG